MLHVIKKQTTYLGSVVDVGIALEKQRSNVLISVMRRNVQRSEPGLGRDVRIVIILKQQTCSLGVIFLGSDVKCWQTDLSSRVIFQQDRYDLGCVIICIRNFSQHAFYPFLHNSSRHAEICVISMWLRKDASKMVKNRPRT